MKANQLTCRPKWDWHGLANSITRKLTIAKGSGGRCRELVRHGRQPAKCGHRHVRMHCQKAAVRNDWAAGVVHADYGFWRRSSQRILHVLRSLFVMSEFSMRVLYA